MRCTIPCSIYIPPSTMVTIQAIADSESRLRNRQVTWADIVREAMRKMLARPSSRVSGSRTVREKSRTDNERLNKVLYLDKRLAAQLNSRVKAENCTKAAFINAAVHAFLDAHDATHKP